MSARKGNWMQTVSGRAFFPLDPSAEDIHIDDIAHALSMLCRFGGHCSQFYSVAEHSVRVSLAIEAEAGSAKVERLWGLLHDATEAYVGDMIWPLKQAPELAAYKAIERRVEFAIAWKFSLPLPMPAIVKRMDLVLLSTEKRDLMSPGPAREDGARREASHAADKLGDWHSDAFEPLQHRIEPFSPDEARRVFLARFDALTRAEWP